MNLKKIKIGDLYTPNNVFLAPLAGYTNGVFRGICRGLGAGLTVTEMVSAKGLCFGSEKTEKLLHIPEDYEGVKACQIFGSEPYYMRKACESRALEPFDLIDINMGCPVPKIYKNGEGSALMNDIPLAQSIVSECKKSGKHISVKFRTGLTENSVIAVDFAKALEDSGADMLCLHGRTRDKIYSGAVDFETIARVKKSLSIPLIANGGVFCKADAEELYEKTGADGIAVARGALYKPWIFAEITGNENYDKKDIVRGQLQNTRTLYGERFACVFMRKMIGFYIKGQKGAVAVKEKLFKADTCEKVAEILESITF